LVRPFVIVHVTALYKRVDSTQAKNRLHFTFLDMVFDFQILLNLLAAFQARVFLTLKSAELSINQEPRNLKSSTCLIGPEERHNVPSTNQKELGFKAINL